MDLASEFAKRVRELRQEAGLTQQQLAERLGVSRDAVSTWETGKRFPSPEVLKALASALNTTVSYLYGESDLESQHSTPLVGLGKRIRTAREHLRLTVPDLAAALGWDPAHLEGIEDGSRETALDMADVHELAMALKVHVADLLGLTDWESRIVQETSRREIEAEVRRDMDRFLGVVRLPVVGAIKAGQPNAAYEEIEGYLPFPRELAGQADYALRVTGDSMVGAGLNDGDFVFIKKQDWANPGQIVVALVNGDEATLKLLVKEDDHYYLRAANPAYPDIEMQPDRVRLIGVFVGKFTRGLAAIQGLGLPDHWAEFVQSRGRTGRITEEQLIARLSEMAGISPDGLLAAIAALKAVSPKKP